MQRVKSACSTPSFEPKRLKTVARETPAASASSSMVAEWNRILPDQMLGGLEHAIDARRARSPA